MPQLSELDRRIISFTESSWFLRGVLPTPEQLKTEFKLSAKQVNEFLQREEIQKSFEGRGIPTIEGRSLTPEQLTAINTILNFSDTRSERKKLQEMGISAQTWNGWRQSVAFKEYFLQRTEGILGDSIPDVHMALTERARNGDLGAIKMVYEMTGRFKDGDVIDPKKLLNSVFEIISRHVQDPNVLLAISNEFAILVGVVPNDTVEENRPPVAGVVVRSEIEGKF